MTEEEERRETRQEARLSFERWIGHIVQAITVAAPLTGTNLLWGLSLQQSVTAERLETLERRLTDIQAATADRFTRTDAAREFTRLERLIADHEDRIRALENP